MKFSIIKPVVIALSALTLIGCMSKELKVEKMNVATPKGVTSLVLLNENSYQVKQIRKSLIRSGFIVRPASSVKVVTRKSDAVDVSYNKAEEQYGVRVTSLPSANNPCVTNRGAVHFTEVEYELINLATNRTIMFVSKGGRNESCPGSVVGGTTTLFNDLATELAKVIQ